MFVCSLTNLGLHIRSILRCADNTGIIKAAIHGIGSNRHGTGKVGDVVRLAVRAKTPAYAGEMMPRGVVVRAPFAARQWRVRAGIGCSRKRRFARVSRCSARARRLLHLHAHFAAVAVVCDARGGANAAHA